MQISVMLSNLRLPFEAALDAVLEMEIPAVQVSIGGEHDAAARRAMKNAVAERGLKISAICVHAGGVGEIGAVAVLEKMKPLISAAKELCDGPTAICQTHVGIMPHTMSGARWAAFVEGCGALAEYSRSVGACLAMETGPEPPRVMEKLLQEVHHPALGVNYDPANFIIWPAVFARHPEYENKTQVPAKPYDRSEAWREYEPLNGVKRLAPYIVHTHAKDARGDNSWNDVPLGEGWIDWPRYLRLLKDNGYDGYLAIEREAGEDRVSEIARGAQFLKKQLQMLD